MDLADLHSHFNLFSLIGPTYFHSCSLFSAPRTWLKPDRIDKMANPVKLHGLIVATGFLPYFIAESFGVSIPMVGLSELDPTYSWSPMSGLLLGMLATFSGVIAMQEIKEEMSLKVFTYYHYPLALFLGKWMMQDSTTTMGKLFFAPPFMFTAWSSMLLFGGKGKKA